MSKNIRAFVFPIYFVAVFILGLWMFLGRNAVKLADRWFDFAVNGKVA